MYLLATSGYFQFYAWPTFYFYGLSAFLVYAWTIAFMATEFLYIYIYILYMSIPGGVMNGVSLRNSKDKQLYEYE
jgi:hypothetical protein